jgi:hypothetical protein
MSIAAFKNSLIPKIKAFANVPIIEAEQTGDKPDGPHVTFKITTPYGKDRGQAEERGLALQDRFVMSRVESFKRIVSFTAYDLDNDASFDLAQAIHDWFDFYGYDQLRVLDFVVVDSTAVQNRDAFVLDGYERRNGFDVTLRLTREIQQEFDYIERVDAFEPHDPTEYIAEIEAETQVIAMDQPLLMAGSDTKIGQSVIL